MRSRYKNVSSSDRVLRCEVELQSQILMLVVYREKSDLSTKSEFLRIVHHDTWLNWHLRTAERDQLGVPSVRLSTSRSLTEDACSAMPDNHHLHGILFVTLSKATHFLCLLSDPSSNISASRSTSTVHRVRLRFFTVNALHKITLLTCLRNRDFKIQIVQNIHAF